MKIEKSICYTVFILAVFFLVSCSPKKMATNVIGDISTSGMIALEDEEDVAFAKDASPALIKTLEVLRGGNPKDPTILTLLSKAYGQYTFGFTEEEMLSLEKTDPAYERLRARAELFYRRGKEYGIGSLIHKSGMKRAFKSSFQDFEKEIKKLGKKDVPALYWTAFNWANWLNLNLDDPSAIVDVPRVEAMIKRVIEISPDYNFGTAQAMLGVLEISRPKMLGGNPKKSLEHFEKAMSANPNYLMTKVLFAQFYAKATMNKDLYKSTLQEVLSADPSAISNQRLAGEMAKRRAKLLLDKRHSQF